MTELEGKKVLVVGLARSGLAAARLAAARGALVTANDIKTESEVAAEARELRSAGMTVVLGNHPRDVFLKADLIVLSPGVPSSIEPVQSAVRAGVEVIGEVELASHFLRGRLIGITGSNGKTTTTTLVAELMRASGANVLVGGNIGTPLASLVDTSSDSTWTVAELSSFQLEHTRTLKVDVAVVTNITPDHMDRYPSFGDYVKAKRRIFRNQTAADFAVLNFDDHVVKEMLTDRDGMDGDKEAASSEGPSLIFFSSKFESGVGRAVSSGRPEIYLRDGMVFTRLAPIGDEETAFISTNDIPLAGMHNVENVMAALGATQCASGARRTDLAVLREAVRTFKGVEHRIELVADIDGVKYYNDSKATNVDSTLKALASFERGIVLILGGRDKGSDFTLLAPLIRERVKTAVIIGDATEKICMQLQGQCRMQRAQSIAEALGHAAAVAEPGDTVLLAPACASFDMFDNYEHRGRVFKEEVHKLAARIAGARG
jgi:UDP-N-acetylmuramoylalanine--D-glutamate ligase